MFKKKLVSIIILTWNRKEDILETIGKVKESYYPDIEIIAVDNGSNDGTGEALKKIHPDVKYLYLPKNIGIGGSRLFRSFFWLKKIILLNDSLTSHEEYKGSKEEIKKRGAARKGRGRLSQGIQPSAFHSWKGSLLFTKIEEIRRGMI